jgi:hypothetical protein
MPDGIMFPFIHGISAFIRKNETGRWVIDIPTTFNVNQYIDKIVQIYKDKSRNPGRMGLTKECYDNAYMYCHNVSESDLRARSLEEEIERLRQENERLKSR